MPLELTLLTDGGQSATEVGAELASFLAAARERLDIAVYDLRFAGAGAPVRDALLDAHARGVTVRLVYNVQHPGPIPVPPPPRTAPEELERLPFETYGVPGVPDLMHHKYVVRDRADVWSGSTNWTDDSWSRQENQIGRAHV